MSGNNTDILVTMANQIGDFFVTMKSREQGMQETANHIKRFWEPRMRRALLAHLDQHNGEGLNAIVLDAVRAHREKLQAGIPADPKVA
jgi:formate dehydrogenase subunit delta